MIGLIELCIKGDLFFFENSFSKEELAKIEDKAKQYFQKETACLSVFLEEIQKDFSLEINLVKIEKVIAV